MRTFCFLFFSLQLSQALADSSPCTYQSWDWDVLQKRTIHLQKVIKMKSMISREEKGSVEGCSVCEEDQMEIHRSDLPKFRICKKIAKKITEGLLRALRSGFPIQSVVGYRVGRSKGPINSAGQRTEFSLHSYGIAIDINSEFNGLYENCPSWGPSCRLIRGGRYELQRPEAITKNSLLYISLIQSGLLWGGEMAGRQKDFMHFSVSGN